MRAIHFAPAGGQTAALVAGVRAARYDRLATLDADLERRPEDLPALLALRRECDAAVRHAKRTA